MYTHNQNTVYLTHRNQTEAETMVRVYNLIKYINGVIQILCQSLTNKPLTRSDFGSWDARYWLLQLWRVVGCRELFSVEKWTIFQDNKMGHL